MRVVGTNDKPDLERDQHDVAIRFVSAGGDCPDAEELMTALCFPVCSPALARSRARPLRTLDDLAFHVRLDYEGVREGRRFSEWDFWFDAKQVRPIEPASTLRFSQYDHAIGVLPHLAQQLRDGVLCAPFGGDSIAKRGSFFLLLVGMRSAAMP